jgi:hypothetical protein
MVLGNFANICRICLGGLAWAAPVFALAVAVANPPAAEPGDAGGAEGAERFSTLYPNNRAPLLPTTFVRLPLGAVKPRGWLRAELIVQANGLTGHLSEVWTIAAKSAWKGDVAANIVTGASANRTALMVPRWLGGLIPLAYLIDDDRLKALAGEYMDTVLATRDLASLCPNLIGWETIGRFLPE